MIYCNLNQFTRNKNINYQFDLLCNDEFVKQENFLCEFSIYFKYMAKFNII